jgi:protein-S-isoprenylcysteine O-methyltransferase Ste14
MSTTAKQIVGQSLILLVVMVLVLFVPAGTLAWPAGWIYLVLFSGFFLVMNLWLGRHNPGLLAERTRLVTADQPVWDKVLFTVLEVAIVAWLGFMALDAGRAHWSPLPGWAQGLGAIVLLGSFYLLFRVFRENSYLAAVIRLQGDRGQTVIATGPYHYVRHPMYVGIVVFMAGTALLLGSGFGLIMGLAPIAVLARRAVLEERALRQALPGYPAYMSQVRYRLIPYVW